MFFTQIKKLYFYIIKNIVKGVIYQSQLLKYTDTDIQ